VEKLLLLNIFKERCSIFRQNFLFGSEPCGSLSLTRRLRRKSVAKVKPFFETSKSFFKIFQTFF